MTHKSTSYSRAIGMALALVLFAIFQLKAQQTPTVPDQLSFGGINVKFDKGAQKVIDEDIRSLMSNQQFWQEKMDRAILYFPIVEGILMDEEVPIDFKYLAVQESSFRPDVVSSSKAVGYWQFKAETALELNLRVDDDVDERKNITSSTHGAAWYLKKNNQLFNNWVSTLYSYYLGAGAVKKIVPANWAYAREVSLTAKTDRYVLRFFAHKIALEAGIEKYRSQNKLVLLESEYGKGLTFSEISRNLGVSKQDLQDYNRWFSGDRVPSDREYLILIPVSLNQVASVREKLSLAPAPSSASAVVSAVYEDSGYPVIKKSDVQSKGKDPHEFYEINGLAGIAAKAGDTPKSMAKAGKLSISRFMKNNDLVQNMPLIPGNIYYLSKKRKQAATPFHTAQPGDTWQSVSQQYGIRLVNLLKYNRTISRNSPLQTGQKLWLTKKRPRRQPIEIVPAPAIPRSQPSVPSTVPAVAQSTTAKEEVEVAVTNDIPANASGRKKYTPVLVETKPEPAKPEVAVTAAPSPKAPSSATTTSQPNDRVIIISQVGEKSSEGEVPTNDVKETPNETIRVNVFESESGSPKTSRPSNAAVKKTHIVTSGETYFSIARKYDLSVRQLLALNSRSIDQGLQTGEELNIDNTTGGTPERPAPVTTATVAKAPIVPEKAPEKAKVEEKILKGASSATYHTVMSGQTYYSISRMHDMSVNELLALNGLSTSDALAVGQKLMIRKGVASPTESTKPSVSTAVHQVRAGETLFAISQRYNCTVAEIKQLNNMTSNTVMVGQKLKIPQR
ncbi:LysM peptidoglycan-binding domain-containing protein [Dyadobacter tibetensis]|uniref:LysM peptidoglycan-binding domain-containing protein n=1 Tax=Dyadobacter tibetensis TaxID=1211851 RepID=UPI00047223CD|nr:LysM peptidoglycan-binding domain-containing protein [Dyadobacter tibetensis]